MTHKKKWIFIGVLLVLAVFIHLFSANQLTTELYYSTGLYPPIAILLRSITGWLPFSLGDVLYGAIIIWIFWKIVKGFKALFKKQFSWDYFIKKFYRFATGVLLVYIAFNLLWGINYNRQGIAKELGLTLKKYSTDDLKILNNILLQKINDNKTAITKNGQTALTSNELFKHSAAAYLEVNKKFTFIKYHTPSIKISLWGWLGNYIGFTGYYNPFTGEAQVNTTVPKFLQPYTTCHEIAHQIGYAKENEANFVGYLAAAASKDSILLYSTYLDLFLYADRNLYAVDSSAAKLFAHQLLPAVKADLKELSDFNRRHQNPIEPVIRWMYGKYLQSNQQPAGVLSYDEVTGFLIAYYKKYGEL